MSRTYIKEVRNECETFEDAADAVIDQLIHEMDASEYVNRGFFLQTLNIQLMRMRYK